MLLIFIPILIAGGSWFQLLIFIISLIGITEFLDIKNSKKEIPNFIKFISYMLVSLIILFNINSNNNVFMIDYKIISALFLTLFLPTVFYHERTKYSINDARVISDAMDLYDFVTSAYGAPTALTEEQKQNILQSVQSMQAGLQPPVYTLLVNMLDMGGYLPSGTPTPAPENKKESSLLQDAVSWVKAKFNQRFGGNPPPGTKNYQNMTDDELYNLVVNEQDGLAYDELKRRGYPLP